MNYLLCILFALSVIGCESTQYAKNTRTKSTRVTYYCAGEDRKWRNNTASGGKIQPYRTVAARRAVPFGTVVRIPYLSALFGNRFGRDFVVQDRGSAVESRKAARKMGLDVEVIDVAVPNMATVKRLASIVPPVLPVEM